MSDETGIRFSVLCCVSGCYAEVHISKTNGEYSKSAILDINLLDSFDALGSNGFGEFSGCEMNLIGALIVEIITTLIFVLVILQVTAKAEHANIAGIVIGLTLTLIHLTTINFTGTSVNPARSLGPALFAGFDHLKQVWVFIVGPLAGAALAALVYPILFTNKTTK